MTNPKSTTPEQEKACLKTLLFFFLCFSCGVMGGTISIALFQSIIK